MYDMVFPHMKYPSNCESGCATWSNLAAEGNPTDQQHVNNMWYDGQMLEKAGQTCAMPGKAMSNFSTYWCYCKTPNKGRLWGYCKSPDISQYPEQINLQHSGRPDTIIISFVTFGDDKYKGGVPVAEVGKTASLHDAKTINGITFEYVETQKLHRKYFMHFIVLDNLKENQQYYYKVKGPSTNFSEVQKFRSLYYGDSIKKVTKLAIFGDMGVYSYNNMANLERDLENGLIDAIVHLGDHAYNIADGDGARGDGYLNAFSRILQRIPWVPVLGNHEYYGGDEFRRYLNQTSGGRNIHRASKIEIHNTGTHISFNLAAGSAIGFGQLGGRNAPKSGTSRYYSADIGLIHFAILDLNAYYFPKEMRWIIPQLKWLEADLIAAEKNRDKVPWIALVAHYPLYCSSNSMLTHNDGQGDETPEMFTGCWSYGVSIPLVRHHLEPLMDKYKVDLFFAGHEHNYESTYPVIHNKRSGNGFKNPQAPVHIVTGAGGAPALDTFGGSAPWTRKRISGWGYGRVEVHNASYFKYEHVMNNGSVVDRVVIEQDRMYHDDDSKVK